MALCSVNAVNGLKPSSVDRLVLNFLRHSDGKIFVRSVEVISTDQRVRFSWINEHEPDCIFEADFWKQISGKVDRTVKQRGLIALPDFEIEGNGYAARCCRLLCVASENGVENVMVRFQKFMGNARNLFSEAYGTEHFSAEDSIRLAAIALETIYLPLRNLSHYLEDLLDDEEQNWPYGFKSALVQIKSRLAEFQFDEDLTKFHFSQQLAMTWSGIDHPQADLRWKRDNIFKHLEGANQNVPLCIK